MSTVSPASGESGLDREDNTPRAVSVKRPDGISIQLPAEYPGTREFDRKKEPRQIARLLSAMQCKADWEAIAKKYGQMRALWVWRWHFDETERAALLEIMSDRCGQPNLFDWQENPLQY